MAVLASMDPKNELPDRPLVQLKMSTLVGRDLYKTGVSEVRHIQGKSLILTMLLIVAKPLLDSQTIVRNNPSSRLYAHHPRTML